MAIYHFSAKIISRASGSSALAAAAYRSASRLHDQRLDRHHDFSNKAGVVHSEVLLPDGAPEHLADREKLWNAVEAVELRKDAQLAREIEFAIPRELNQAEGIRLAREFVQAEFVDRGMVADLNVHWDVGGDGEPKPHAHVMLALREVNADGFGKKNRDWNRTDLLEKWRERWAWHVNARLAELDIDARVDHRSLEAQGIDLEPQNKIGPAAARMAEQGLASERLEEHHDIARANGEKLLANPALALDAITRTQATFTTRDLAMFVHRHSEGKDQFDQVMAAVRASPELVRLGKDGRGEHRFTSRDMIETEARLERVTVKLDARRGHGMDEQHRKLALARAEMRGLILSSEQRSAFDHVTSGKDLGVVVGYAGTGKSAMLGVAREAWESAGYQVQGLALSGIAAENLESGSGIASRTIASIEHQWGQGRELLTDRSILVIDEAGMVGSRQMERMIAEAEKRHAKVVLVGDPEQLQAIEAGAAFRSVAERHGAIEITDIRRQREDWQRMATRQLATGRTAEALEAYAGAGMVVDSETRVEARSALIERWDRERIADPATSRMILTHTNQECDELNALARDAMKRSGALGADIAVKTTRGERLFGAGDRVMFLRNERSLGVKNGSLGTIEQVDHARMAVRVDDGRKVAFDHKNYGDVTHGYAATIHKAQGVTVDRVHLLATPGLDRHAAYVALSRHRDAVQLHYGRDDFADQGKLARTLSRDRPKDNALDYDAVAERFAARRGVERSRILDTLAKEPLAELERSAPAPARRRSMFDGLRLSIPEPERAPTKLRFDGLRLSMPATAPEASATQKLERAVEGYARAVQDAGRMTGQGRSPLEVQKAGLARTAEAVNALHPHGAHDLDMAFERTPGLVSEAANGRTANAIRQMQLEAEVRTNPELRADRFVQAWQQLQARRGKLGGWENEEKRAGVENAMRSMTKGLEKDPALGAALSRRGSQLFGRQWSPEWTPGSRDGGVSHALGDDARTRSIILLDRSRSGPWNWNVAMDIHEPPVEADQTVQAFNDMSRKLAGLTAAVDGFAARQQELHARDYGPDLEKIRDGYEKVCGAINILAKRPAMTLRPQDIASQIEAAGTQGRADDHRAWSAASHAVVGTVQELKLMVASAHSAETQRLWIAGTAALALVVGFAFGTVIPTRIAQAVPESWHWPEDQAAEILGRTPWDAGVRLMQVANPQQLRALNDAALLAKDNANALANCRHRAERRKSATKCSIDVPPAKPN